MRRRLSLHRGRLLVAARERPLASRPPDVLRHDEGALLQGVAERRQGLQHAMRQRCFGARFLQLRGGRVHLERGRGLRRLESSRKARVRVHVSILRVRARIIRVSSMRVHPIAAVRCMMEVKIFMLVLVVVGMVVLDVASAGFAQLKGDAALLVAQTLRRGVAHHDVRLKEPSTFAAAQRNELSRFVCRGTAEAVHEPTASQRQRRCCCCC